MAFLKIPSPHATPSRSRAACFLALTILQAALLIGAISILSSATMGSAAAAEYSLPPKTYYRSAQILGHSIFYREAGDPKNDTILLLHGVRSSSHYYRELIPMLSRYYHIIAPDYLGSGYSERPDPNTLTYTFDTLADHTVALLQSLNITKVSVFMHDFGAPVGFRLMSRHPEMVGSLIVQNANAYLEGISPALQTFFSKTAADRSQENLTALYARFTREALERQELRDTPVEKRDLLSPDSWVHDLYFLQSEKDKKIQIQLLQDYQSNVAQYPSWQAIFRKYQFPTLIVWGRRDPSFIVAGAEAYLRDLPKAELHLLDAGHYAVEEAASEIAEHVLSFMAKAKTMQ